IIGGGSGSDFALARYNVDGTLDSSFDGDGTVTTSFGSASSIAALAIDGDNRIVAAGVAGTDFALARYDSSGALDTSFNTTGKVTTSFGLDSRANAIAIGVGGQIVAAGEVVAGAVRHLALARYTTGGTPDASFGTGGQVVTSFGTSSVDRATSVNI